jgi:hypothetical protein
MVLSGRHAAGYRRGVRQSLSRGYFADERVRAFHAEARKTHCIN